MSKVAKVLSTVLVLALVVILAFAVTGAVFAHNGNGAGDGTGTYADCPGDCGECSRYGHCGDCDCDHVPHLWGGPGPHHANHE